MSKSTLYYYSPILIVLTIYAVLLYFNMNHCYFWDNIQQTSKEAHWFYENNFSSILLPDFSSQSAITGTGYHPPLTGIITALLWKIFGVKLWVSHVFIFAVALILIYNTIRLSERLFSDITAPWFTLLIMMDPTIMTQVAIASPDIILLTATVVSIRAVVWNKPFLLGISLVFLGLVNGRGMFACGIIFMFYISYTTKQLKDLLSFRYLLKKTVPFIPAFVVLLSYFSYYFANRAWFFSAENNFPWSSGWQSPDTLYGVFKNIISYLMRILENGRIIVYFTLGIVLIQIFFFKKKKLDLTRFEISAALAFLSFFVLYLYFAAITKNVISSRYYMPMNFFGFLIVFSMIRRIASSNRFIPISIFTGIFLLTGNLWVYPEKRTNFWDCTLAHIPFYELRVDCFNYLDKNAIGLEKVASGFCLYDNQRYIDLKPRNRFVNKSEGPQTEYYLYSNISNLSDDFIDELNDPEKWKLEKEFRKDFVFIKILKRIK